MSSAKIKPVSEINLEEFERRLRAASAPQGAVEDPLSELTRLVNTIAADQTDRPERRKTEKIVDIASARMPKVEQLAVVPRIQDEKPASPRMVESPRPATLETETPTFAPSLRASIDESAAPSNGPVVADFGAVDEEPAEDAATEYDEFSEPPLRAGERIALDRPARPRSWYLKVASLTALAVMMAGGAVAMKIGVPGLHKSPPLILAVDGPSKVAPPSEAAVQSAGDTGALLLKDSAAPTSSSVKLVNTEEQPVDLLAQQKPTPAPLATPSSPSPAAGAQTSGDVSVAPAPNTPIVAPSEGMGGAPASGPTLFPSAKRVKTVSVRPDGTLISADSEPEAPVAQDTAPTAGPTPGAGLRKAENAGAAALPATPTIDLPPKPAAKSSARVNIAKSDAADPSDPSKPMQLGPGAHAAKAAKSKPAAVVADATPTGAATDATPTFENAPAGGRWAVQLAAPRSESEAQGTMSRLQSKYNSDLGSASLGVHKAEVNGETIYRVRASGLSKAEALSLCSKLKSSGGDCFVTRN